MEHRSLAQSYKLQPIEKKEIAPHCILVLTWVASSQVEVREVNHVVVALLLFIKEPNFSWSPHDIVSDYALKAPRRIRNWQNYWGMQDFGAMRTKFSPSRE